MIYFGLHYCIVICTPSGLNLQTTNAILQTNQLLQNWMRLQYPNLGTDFALAGQQLSRNPALYQQFQHLARLQQLQQSQSLLLQGHTLLPAMAAPSATGQPFLGQQTLGLLGQSFYPGLDRVFTQVAAPLLAHSRLQFKGQIAVL